MNDKASPQAAAELQALLKKGFQALSSGEIPTASQCCQQALKLQPDLPQGHFLVGLVALQAQDRAENEAAVPEMNLGSIGRGEGEADGD